MDEEYLDVVIAQGTTYETPARVGYVVEEIGCDTGKTSSNTTLKIENSTTGQIAREVANIHKTESYNHGLLDLRDQFYYIPPETQFEIDESAASNARLKGRVLELGPNEDSPASLMDRFDAQSRVYRRYWWDETEVTTGGGNWADGAEDTVLTLSPETIEEYTLDGYLMTDTDNVSPTIADGDIGLTIYYDNAKIPFDRATNLNDGLDYLATPLPPTDSTEKVPFTLEELPIEVEGDHDLEFRMVNNSGGTIGDTGSNLGLFVLVEGLYERR